MNLLVSEYKRSEYLRDAVENESQKLKAALRCVFLFFYRGATFSLVRS